jgi:hypothetical protein
MVRIRLPPAMSPLRICFFGRATTRRSPPSALVTIKPRVPCTSAVFGISRAIGLLGKFRAALNMRRQTPPQATTTSPTASTTLKVGPNQTYKAPSAAAAVAKNGDHIEIEPGEYFDCAVWNADNLVIEGTDSGVVITDKTCNGMGLFVIWGNNITVRNLQPRQIGKVGFPRAP